MGTFALSLLGTCRRSLVIKEIQIVLAIPSFSLVKFYLTLVVEETREPFLHNLTNASLFYKVVLANSNQSITSTMLVAPDDGLLKLN